MPRPECRKTRFTPKTLRAQPSLQYLSAAGSPSALMPPGYPWGRPTNERTDQPTPMNVLSCCGIRCHRLGPCKGGPLINRYEAHEMPPRKNAPKGKRVDHGHRFPCFQGSGPTPREWRMSPFGAGCVRPVTGAFRDGRHLGSSPVAESACLQNGCRPARADALKMLGGPEMCAAPSPATEPAH